ncbi:MAG: helix-turn-helix domain-containing protein, partial [Clostridia bacterium]|nr:helix-turn-helix domain-containing protein [Clostridia bacterium]
MKIGERIKMLRIENHLSQLELAKAADTTKQTIHKYETGIVENIPAGKIKAIADRLMTTPAYLMGWEDSTAPSPSPTVTEEYTTFPVIGEVAAGYDHTAIEDWEGETVDIPNSYLKGRSKEEFFVLKVKGD